MKRLRSYVGGSWWEADSGFVPLVDPSTEEEIARVSSAGVDFQAALEHARQRGGPALRKLTFAERGQLLKAMSKAVREHRDELLELSRRNNGTTVPDGAFDIDGASGTLAYYFALSKRLGDRSVLAEGEGVQLARSEAFWGQHLLASRRGVAVLINAFNFPAWGIAEKAACALLAGMPVIAKPATSTALVAARWAEIVVAAGVLPEGALQLVCGSTGDLLERLTSQDVVAFTGSADTAHSLRKGQGVLSANSRFNVEADSLNAAVLGPDVAPDSVTLKLFVRDVVREMTQKAGQKCTAVRRVLVPSAAAGAVEEALVDRLSGVTTGNPADEAVRMGPLANARQLEDAVVGVAELSAAAELVCGSERRVDGVGSPPGKGYFFAPTLLRAADGASAVIHQREVFAPVATLIPYDGQSATAAEIVGRAGGTLVTSVYADDRQWLGDFTRRCAATTARPYVGSEQAAGEAPGSGVALPQCLHGGPGRAGGGE
jgi:oxepin-CoA hydrolase/3-oxo-5,6-dehydrosuberyl-CoA semialdehyde dehydrogenase